LPPRPAGGKPMRKSMPITREAALKEACRENPLDAVPRLVYADWLEEQGCNEEAEDQRERAARCQAFDPDFNYESVLADLDLPEDWEVAVFPLGASGFVWVNGLGDDADFWGATKLQAWLLEKADEEPMHDPDRF